MILSSNLGYPRIGSNRELKWLLESFWKKEINEDYLFKKISEIKKSNWIKQKKSGINYIPSNDFSLYDHVLDMCLTLNVIPDRFNKLKKKNILDLYFAMARGYQNGKIDLKAMEMTKWFDTNYHYIVPEFKPNQNFKLSFYKIIDEFLEAKNFGIKTRPVILGPLSFLHLGKSASKKFNKFNLLSKLVPVYKQILKLLKDFGAEWVQIDEPILSLDLDGSLKKKFISTYKSLSKNSPKILLTSYFSSILPNYNLLKKLNVDGLHIDLVNTLNKDLDKILLNFPKNKLFSAGIINGRNIWKNDLSRSIEILRKIKRRIKDDKIIISSSCSLLHSPVSLDNERDLNANVKDWLAFADQKLIEIVFLQKYFNSNFLIKSNYLISNSISLKKRKNSKLINDQKVKKRIKSINSKMLSRNNKYFLRKMLQEELNLPLFPTTTIGSFPQTKEVRKLRLKYKKKEITKKTYENFLK